MTKPRIISSLLHQIDLDLKISLNIKITNQNEDLDSYLDDLLNEITAKTQHRAYEFHRETTESYNILLSYSKENDLSNNQSADAFASRLLDIELKTEQRYGHLNTLGKGHVKKGSFLQFLYKKGNNLEYLGVKIEHQTFLDETDLRKRIGLSTDRKVYKACRVTFSKGNPDEVYIYDTNTKPSVYWWQDFLELKESRTDKYNTKQSIDEVVRVVNQLKSDYPADHTILRNSCIASFKQEGEMRYVDFVENTFKNYSPITKDLKEKLPNIIEKLLELPEKKKFDTTFNLVPSEVQYKKTKFVLTQEISLVIAEGILNLNDKVWAEKTSSGKKLVVIESAEGFERFKLKERK
ncbi:hypothetical protein [Leptospira licerasiae]|uniref:hypothetical protein n=1 Tax=Leptospira licerasiae TaxID=447106 RepID=UPI003019ADA7